MIVFNALQVNTMIENIGFPKEFVDSDHLDEMYNHVSHSLKNSIFLNNFKCFIPMFMCVLS